MNSLKIFYHVQEVLNNHLKPFGMKAQINMTPSAAMGDLSSNFLLILKSKKFFPDILESLTQSIINDLDSTIVDNCQIVNNFFNIFLKKSIYIDLLKNLDQRDNNKFLMVGRGVQQLIQEKKIVHFEFGSINPTGPIHLGHLRAIIVAQCLSNLYQQLEIPLFKEYFLNDCGNQINEFLKSIYYRWQQSQGITIDETTIPYKGEYIKNLIPHQWSSTVAIDEIDQYKVHIIEQVKDQALTQLKQLGVFYDQVTYESKLRENHPLILKVFNFLVSKQLLAIIEGDDRLVDLEQLASPCLNSLETIPQGTIVLLTQSLGFDKNKVIMKNQELTYFGADIIYLYEKYHRGFHSQYCFLGEDHIGHLTMLQKLASALWSDLEFVPKKIGFVKVFNNNQLVPMSKRKGQFLSMADADQLIGLDFLKIIMISRATNNELIFHVSNAHEDNIKNNCLFYIQYCHARICSVLNKINPEDYPLNSDYENYLPEEHQILRHLFWMDWLMDQWAVNQDVNGVYQYVYDLATYFHTYFNVGSINPALKFITDDKKSTAFRINLLLTVKKTLSFILKKIIGVEPLERM
jgi:arginyl-tRNA synthetase